jgi:nitrogen regulatory protein PII
MKKIEAVILPSKINSVKDVLRKIGIINMTVSKVRRLGGQTSHSGYCRGGKYESKYEPVFFAKTKIEIEVAEEELEKVLGAIEDCTEGTTYGDEKVFVYSLDETMRLGRKARSVAGI